MMNKHFLIILLNLSPKQVLPVCSRWAFGAFLWWVSLFVGVPTMAQNLLGTSPWGATGAPGWALSEEGLSQKMMNPEGSSFQEIEAAALWYINSHPEASAEEDGFGANFTRWSLFWRSRVDADGHFSPLMDSYRTIAEGAPGIFCNGSTIDDGIAWQCLGPFNSQGADGYYNGLAQMPNHQNQGRVEAISVHPDNVNDILVAGSAGGGIWRSVDGGEHWSNKTDVNFLSSCGVYSFVRHPVDPNIVYASTNINRGFPFISYEVGNSDNGILLSMDGGESWSLTPYGGTATLAIDPSSTIANTILYSMTGYREIYRYNGPANMNSGENANFSSVFRIDYYCHGLCGSDSCIGWNGPAIIMDMDITSGGDLWVCSFVGIYKLTSELLASGVGQIISNPGGTASFNFDYNTAPTPTKVVNFIPSAYGSTVEISGHNPSTVHNPIRYFFKLDINEKDDIMLGGTFRYLATGNGCNSVTTDSPMYFFSSTDDGQNWVGRETSIPDIPPYSSYTKITPVFALSPFNTGVIYAEASNRHLYRSYGIDDDTGNILFRILNNGAPTSDFNHVDVRAILVYDGMNDDGGTHDVVFVCNDGGISKSVAGGDNWQDITGEGLVVTHYYGLDVADYEQGFVIGGAQDGSINYFRSGIWDESTPGGDNGDVAIVNPSNVYHNESGGYIPFGVDRCHDTENSSSYILEGFYGVFPFYRNPNNRTEVFGGSINGILRRQNVANGGLVTNTIPTGVSNLYINAIGMAGNNNDVLYFSAWGLDSLIGTGSSALLTGAGIHKVVGLSTGNFVVSDVGSNLWVNKKLGEHITDIVVASDDVNKVWVSFAGFNSDYQVWATTDGGLSWSNVGACLPPLPITSLAYQPGSPDRVFAGTDIGVFFRDNTMNEWAYYGQGGPCAPITDMEVHRCSNKLVVSTGGRGMWSVDMPVPTEAQDVFVDTDWGAGPHLMPTDLVVHSGATLRLLPNAVLEMGKDRSIFIEPGGKVVLDHARVTNSCDNDWGRIVVKRGAKLVVDGGNIRSDNARWGGIEVWGNTSVVHGDLFGSVEPSGLTAADYVGVMTTASDPGVVVISNGSLIERGNVNTITTTRAGGYFPDHYGGLVYVENSVFDDCRKGVSLMRYEHRNYCQFRGVEFIHSIAEQPFEGISIWACKDVHIDNCSFVYTGGVSTTGNYARLGIATFDAESLLVDNACTFVDLKQGIYLQSTDASVGTATVGNGTGSENSFNNCAVGIGDRGTAGLSANHNSFFGNGGQIGIGIGSTAGYEVRDNVFSGLNVGVLAKSTGAATAGNNLLDCNSYSNCRAGNVLWGNNEGLHLLDNNFATTEVDNHLLDGLAEPSSIAFSQGSFEAPVFNLFSTAPNTDHFRATQGGGTNTFIYFFHTDDVNYTTESNLRLEPICDLVSNCTSLNNFLKVNVSKDVFIPYNGCLDLNGDGVPGNLPPDIEDCQTKECYYAVKAYWENLKGEIDGGDKAALLEALYNSPEALATYQKYMAASPYLSDEVLLEVAQMETMSPNRRANILLANAPLSDGVMYAVQDVVAENVYQLLYTIKYYTKLSARDNLNIQISKETARKEQLLQELLQKFADAKDYAQLDELLTVENTTYAMRALLWSKIERGDYGMAAELLAYLPAETPDEQDYKKVQTIYLQFRSATNGFSLTNAQYQTLRTIADAETEQSARACALLALLRGEYCDWVVPEDAAKTAAAAPHYRTVPLLSHSVLNRLRVSPNPAGISFEVQLPIYFAEQRGSSVQVLDMSGRVVQQVPIDKEQQKVVVASENLANGLYVVRYFADGIVVGSAKVVVQH